MVIVDVAVESETSRGNRPRTSEVLVFPDRPKASEAGGCSRCRKRCPGYEDSGTPVADPRPSPIESILQSIPQYEMLKKGIAGGETYDTATLLDALSGEALMRNPETGEAMYPASWMEMLAKIGGVGQMDYDVAGYQERLAEEQKAAMNEAMKRYQAEQMAGV